MILVTFRKILLQFDYIYIYIYSKFRERWLVEFLLILALFIYYTLLLQFNYFCIYSKFLDLFLDNIYKLFDNISYIQKYSSDECINGINSNETNETIDNLFLL